MVVYNKTDLSKEEAYQSLIKETRLNYVYRFILSAILFICGIAILTIGYIQSEDDYIIMGYIFLVFGAIYFLFTLIAILKAPKKVYQRNQDVCENGITYNYTFKEQSFEVVVLSMGRRTKIPYKYQEIKKIKEFSEMYQFNLKSKHILYVKKSGFENSRMEDFFKKNVSKNKVKIKKEENL